MPVRTVVLKPRAAKALNRIPEPAKTRIRQAILRFAEGAPLDVKKLQVSGAWRLRVGDYRVIFDDEANAMTVLDIASRQGIYKG